MLPSSARPVFPIYSPGFNPPNPLLTQLPMLQYAALSADEEAKQASQTSPLLQAGTPPAISQSAPIVATTLNASNQPVQQADQFQHQRSSASSPVLASTSARAKSPSPDMGTGNRPTWKENRTNAALWILTVLGLASIPAVYLYIQNKNSGIAEPTPETPPSPSTPDLPEKQPNTELAAPKTTPSTPAKPAKAQWFSRLLNRPATLTPKTPVQPVQQPKGIGIQERLSAWGRHFRAAHLNTPRQEQPRVAPQKPTPVTPPAKPSPSILKKPKEQRHVRFNVVEPAPERENKPSRPRHSRHSNRSNTQQQGLSDEALAKLKKREQKILRARVKVLDYFKHWGHGAEHSNPNV